ncbi:MAG TPA: large conductance mechanosensitive channel protein MscL [Fimbriimonadaceae bacterium]|nr:large conductance mechanosensitive channel protein MscL [Fimbriimonadaceae bacterium]
MLKEFREFALKGNMIDLAVGVIIGGAFGTIVTSLVNDVIMPAVGMLLGKVDFKDLFAVLGEGATVKGPYDSLKAAQDAGAVTLNYGQFINTIINFLIVAFAIFFVIRAMNRMKREAPAEPEAPATPSEEVVLLTEIRDALKAK